MSTLLIAVLLGILVILSVTHLLRQKGACGDCHCSCPIKDEMKSSNKSTLR
ncbi:FeoB-associated Cys-rich membrane protein [Streptococcus castoreus]|uniref:hypothetical protein n=1 Tax=Streptococcus castoreus TaxID=254786 RepID=UPI0004039D82|nr:hypothetical protein [Streptococcus castoreus]